MRWLQRSVWLVILLAGCRPEGDGWPRAAVEGTVMLDNQPLDTGQVTFFPIDGTKGPAAGGEIRQGAFALPRHLGPVVGTQRVEIRSVGKTGRMVPSPSAVEGDGEFAAGMLVAEHADRIPKRYNTYSELTATIEEVEVNQVEFRLTSDAPQKPAE